LALGVIVCRGERKNGILLPLDSGHGPVPVDWSRAHLRAREREETTMFTRIKAAVDAFLLALPGFVTRAVRIECGKDPLGLWAL
jgi:hypothetical protein